MSTQWSPRAAMAAGITAVALFGLAVAAGSSPPAYRRHQLPDEASPPAAPILPLDKSPSEMPVNHDTVAKFAAAVIILMVAAIVLTILAIVVRFLFGLFNIRLVWREDVRWLPRVQAVKLPELPVVETERRTVVASLDAGLAELADTDADPRRAVIACWVRLERAAGQAGVRRSDADTPADLVEQLLTWYAVDPSTLAGFVEVYRTARYTRHPVVDADRADAVAALHRLRTEIAAKRPDVQGEMSP